MHPEAMQGVESMVAAAKEHGWEREEITGGLDVGGQDVNGSARHLIPGVTGWESLDLHDPTATHNADARSWCCIKEHYETPFDVVLCTEVLEHVRWWPLVVRSCFEALWPGGLLLITAAAPPRPPHSAQGLTTKPDDEWYGNIDPDELRALVDEVFKPAWVTHAWRENPGDVYLASIKG